MIDREGFKKWLHKNTSFSEKVINDVACRMHRADELLPWCDEDVYQFRLEHIPDYSALTVSVRSQCRKAVKLYTDYMHTR
jgi:DNA (cytosine-5)-methyltransferase 1